VLLLALNKSPLEAWAGKPNHVIKLVTHWGRVPTHYFEYLNDNSTLEAAIYIIDNLVQKLPLSCNKNDRDLKLKLYNFCRFVHGVS